MTSRQPSFQREQPQARLPARIVPSRQRGQTAPGYAKDQDAKALEKILALAPKGLQTRVARDDISMCGYGPVTAVLVAAKKLGAREAKLLKYGSSSDVSGDRDTAVGYGAVALYR